jgi:hypothetical protein
MQDRSGCDRCRSIRRRTATLAQGESVRVSQIGQQFAQRVRLAVAVGVALEQHDFIGARAGHDEVAGRSHERPAGEGHVRGIHLEPEAIGDPQSRRDLPGRRRIDRAAEQEIEHDLLVADRDRTEPDVAEAGDDEQRNGEQETEQELLHAPQSSLWHPGSVPRPRHVVCRARQTTVKTGAQSS